jgi:hypothetical protein
MYRLDHASVPFTDWRAPVTLARAILHLWDAKLQWLSTNNPSSPPDEERARITETTAFLYQYTCGYGKHAKYVARAIVRAGGVQDIDHLAIISDTAVPPSRTRPSLGQMVLMLDACRAEPLVECAAGVSGVRAVAARPFLIKSGRGLKGVCPKTTLKRIPSGREIRCHR